MIAHSIAVAALAGLVLTAAPSLAAQTAGRSTTTQVAEAAQVAQTASVAEGDEDGANCNKQRRRLWIEGEGWIVRRVTICR
ncbi:MAG: hypothetical protein PGN25_13420 [Methylorubrum populi]